MRVSEKGRRLNIVVHREELLDQVCTTLDSFGVGHEVLAAGRYPRFNTNVLVSSVFTLARRLEKIPAPDMLIIDEAHHAIGKSTWGKVVDYWPLALLLGVTATPTRLSGEGLGQIFQDMVMGPSVADLIESGDLSDYRMFAPATIDTSDIHKRGGDYKKSELAEAADKRVITGSAIEHYKKHADGLPAVAFCVSIEHAHHVAEQFRAEGYRALAIDGKMDKGLRRDAVRDFKNGSLQILTSCDLISEGFDCPGIVVGIFLRPTQSTGLWLQQVGRCLRTAPGKSRAILLDHAGNSAMHGLPDADREWTLEGRNSKEKSPGVRTCPRCFYVMPISKMRCPDCDHVFTSAENARIVEEVSGELKEIDEAEIMAQRKARKIENWKAQSLDALIELEKERGYKPGWAQHVFQARQKRRGNHG